MHLYSMGTLEIVGSDDYDDGGLSSACCTYWDTTVGLSLMSQMLTGSNEW